VAGLHTVATILTLGNTLLATWGNSSSAWKSCHFLPQIDNWSSMVHWKWTSLHCRLRLGHRLIATRVFWSVHGRSCKHHTSKHQSFAPMDHKSMTILCEITSFCFESV
jgi:hypothetical protein